MKTTHCFCHWAQTIAWIGCLLLGFITEANGQEKQALSQSGDKEGEKTDKNFKVRIAVEEVRLDAVVVDRKGRQITGLNADDFEVYQDDLPQEILSCIYVSDQADPSAKPALSPRVSSTAPPIPAPMPTRDKVRRVIAFIVDDLSMSFENIHHARLALTRFVERQMQPGDLVAILRTSRGISAIQMFLSDKAQLKARIDTVRWGENVGRDLSADNLYSYFDGQLAALRYCIRALKDMPGRKALLLLTAQSTIPVGLPNRESLIPAGSPIRNDPVDYWDMYQRSYNRLADDALRAGVVIHTLDIRGLEAPIPGPSFPGGGSTFAQIATRNTDALNPLPQKTGGLFLKDSNFFVNGIGEVNDALKGYYILSYAPPSTTFKLNRNNIYHRTRIKVKRRGATVHTRDGFYGVAEPPDDSALAQNPLRDAIQSPFQHSDLTVHLASGYINDPDTGYLLRSWLLVDAQNVKMTAKEKEGHFISLKTVCVTSDINGGVQDANIMNFEFLVKDENLQWVKEHGIPFSLVLPVKKPGAYYVRVAVQDQKSGKVGSAYQFVDIPDLKKNRLNLSALFIMNRDDDDSWIRGSSKEAFQSYFTPILRRDTGRSPALRNFLPGEGFEYMTVVYSAKHRREETPDLESHFVLYRDGVELYQSEPQKLTLTGETNFDRIPLRRRMVLGNALQEGDYVLQLLVKDEQRGKKDGIATQALNFSIFGK
jgi:VWFA-related protein